MGSLTLVGVCLGLVGDENVSYQSHRELNAVRGMLGNDVETVWIATDSPSIGELADFDGIWLTPGSPYADDTAVYQAVRWAREHDVPFLGTCGGLQYAVIEYFRNVLDVTTASHAESDGVGAGNVITALACSLNGQERVVRPIAGTHFFALVNGESFVGMHYCNYGPGLDVEKRRARRRAAASATARVRSVCARARGCQADSRCGRRAKLARAGLRAQWRGRLTGPVVAVALENPSPITTRIWTRGAWANMEIGTM